MTSLKEVYSFFLASSGVETDTRKSVSNKLFFALKGASFDGNTYALSAIKKGAVAAIVDQHEIATAHPKCLLVDDVLQTLQSLANHHRKQFDIPVIALTGSNGKTTTKELIAAVLNSSFNVLSTEGNLNNHIGVPLTLLRLNNKHSHALIEMGANHLNEIDFLCSIAQPTHGLITNVGKAHLEGFGSENGVLQGKTELYRFLEKNDGVVFINQQDGKLLNALGENLSIAYTPSDFIIHKDHPTLELSFNNIKINTQLAGIYNKTNIAAAVCVGSTFGVPIEKSAAAISDYTPVNHRSQMVQQNNKTIVLDAYNANPTSMHAAVNSFSKRAGKKAVILGTMAELGSHETNEHEALVKLVKTMKIECCYWVGSPYKPFVDSNWFETTKSLEAHLKNNPIEADKILVKGSRSVRLESLLPYL